MTDRPAPRSPLTSALVVVGLGTLIVAVTGVVAGLVTGDLPGTLGRVGTIGMVIVAVLGVLVAAWPSLRPASRRPH